MLLSLEDRPAAPVARRHEQEILLRDSHEHVVCEQGQTEVKTMKEEIMLLFGRTRGINMYGNPCWAKIGSVGHYNYWCRYKSCIEYEVPKDV